LLGAGALDAFLTPVQMKKNRPGVLLTVLVEPEKLAVVQDVIFRETTSFGVRMSEKERVILEREFCEVETVYGPVTIKLGIRNGEVMQRSPEFASCLALAEKTGRPVREIFAAAVTAGFK